VTSRLYSGLATLFHSAAVAACIVALLSFTLFAFDQVTTASQAQQSELAGSPAPAPATAAASGVKPHSHVRRTLDDASSELGAPFKGITNRSSSVWGQHILQTMLVLLVYGFSLGFAARFIRVHA
jgi:hypothetical protein